MIESFSEVQTEKIRLRFINYDQKPIEIKGKVIYCTQKKPGIFQIGVRLMGTDYENLQFVMQLVRFYELKKEESSPGIVYSNEDPRTSAPDTILL